MENKSTKTIDIYTSDINFKKGNPDKKQKINNNFFKKNCFKCIFIIAVLIDIFLFIKAYILKDKIIEKDIINKKTQIEEKQLKEKNEDFVLDNIYLDKYETNIYNNIKRKIELHRCSQMWANQRQFLNGVVRKFKPKKILEIGVAHGGGSSIILNAIQDIEGAHLYSIDLNNNHNIGKCVRNLFPKFVKKWTLFKGNVAAKFMEQIGDNIDMVFIDSAHFEPGEILDFIIALPFLKENAIVGFHDIANQITKSGIFNGRDEWAPYIAFNMIRGKSYLPSGNIRLKHDIGIKILESNQKKYYYDYFRALGGQWQYFPKEKYLNLITEYFVKYYDKDCLTIFNETVKFNRGFVKKNPKKFLYRYNSD